jgi:hypothetical protein
MSYINESYAWDATIYELCSISYYNIGLLNEAIKYSDMAVKLEPASEILISNNTFLKELKIKNKELD